MPGDRVWVGTVKYQILNIVDNRTGVELDPILFIGDGYDKESVLSLGKDSLEGRLELDEGTADRNYSFYITMPATIYTLG